MHAYCICQTKGCGARTFYAIEPKVCPKYCKDCQKKEVREEIEKEYDKNNN